MGIGNLARAATTERAAEQRIAAGAPLAVLARSIGEGDGTAMTGVLLVDALGLKAGTELSAKEGPGESGGVSLSAASLGGKHERSRPGDVLVFSGAFLDGGQALVGPVVARVHDGLEGHVQVMTAMVRPTKGRASKKGASQEICVADCSRARVIANAEAFMAFTDEELSRPWPGGSPGLILRDADGETAEFFTDLDKTGQAAAQALCRGLVEQGLFSSEGYKVEAIPAWTLPMGRDQVLRDVSPKEGSRGGRFARRYAVGSKEIGFVPSIVILADEEEWAFGGKTGRVRRVATGVHPLLPEAAPIVTERLPTNMRAMGGKAVAVRCLHSDEAMARDATARAGRRSGGARPGSRSASPPQTSSGTAQAPRPRPSGLTALRMPGR